MDKLKVNQCIEALCANGCDAVRATISSMEMGSTPAQLQDLTQDEHAIVLSELKSIMSVYDTRKS